MATNLNVEDIKIEEDKDKNDQSPHQSPASEQFEDVSLDFQNKNDSAPPKKNPRHRNGIENQNNLKPEKQGSSFFEEVSGQISHRISNIIHADNDGAIYIPGLDDEPFQGQGQGQQRAGSQTHRTNRSSSLFDQKQNVGQSTSRDINASNIQREVGSTNDDEFEVNQNAGDLNQNLGGNTSVLQTYANMFKCFIGIGILATPAAIQNVGIFGGAMGILVCGCINLYTMKMQIDCKLKVGMHIKSYSELGFAIFGPWGKAFIDFCITVSQFGFCIAYLIFVGKQLDQVICIETEQDYCDNKNVYIFLGSLVLVPVCWLKTFKFIAYISLFSNISIIFALIVIMCYSEKSYVDQPELHENIRYIDFSHLPLFFGIAVFNFEGNGVVLNLHASMKDPSEFPKIMRNVLVCIITILIVFSVSSYEAFGYQISDMVTMNLPHDNLTSSVQLLYCLGLLGSFPVQVMPAIDIIEKTECFVNMANPFLKFGDQYEYAKNIVLRTIIVVSTGLLAMIVPKFGLFINLTGAFACTALAFILPTLMYQKVFKDEMTPLKSKLHQVLVIFGTICGTISFIMSIVEIVRAFAEEAKADEELAAILPPPSKNITNNN